ncbi:hypothetical protein DPMN_015289 [Dreissena polymorpha]|uniref:Uncharacterized protein n=1 Tax=Dreissena polymorpha TaxID=45954 RepID=A0A9D4NCI7_DREPO|nr:hypothetical protein DPMN_015289 [Dreissena polymorpha]
MIMKIALGCLTVACLLGMIAGDAVGNIQLLSICGQLPAEWKRVCYLWVLDRMGYDVPLPSGLQMPSFLENLLFT